MGQNPAIGSQNGGLMRRGLRKMKWLVVRDLNEIETATFWRDAPEVQSGEVRTEDIQTEVFLMPAATHVEKAGSFTQTQRMVQWRDKALDPPGDARSDLWFMHHLTKRVKAHYAGSQDPKDWPIVNLKWDYSELAEGNPGRAIGRGCSARDQRLRRRHRRAGPWLRAAGRTTAALPAAAGSTPAYTPTA